MKFCPPKESAEILRKDAVYFVKEVLPWLITGSAIFAAIVFVVWANWQVAVWLSGPGADWDHRGLWPPPPEIIMIPLLGGEALLAAYVLGVCERARKVAAGP
jgi:hypothetical protein